MLAELIVEHDDLARLAIDTGGKEFRRGNDGRKLLVGINEIVELGLPFLVVARDLHDIGRMVPHDIGVLVH